MPELLVILSFFLTQTSPKYLPDNPLIPKGELFTIHANPSPIIISCLYVGFLIIPLT